MGEKKYNKYTIFTDRFPYIIFVIIIVLAIVFIVQIKERYPLSFFSNTSTTTQSETSVSYSIFVASPSEGEVFDFVNKNESVPIEIKSKEIEDLNYKLNLVINDKETIKTFSSPPYKYNWHPLDSGEYSIVANLVDNNNNTISSSNKIKFVVNLQEETTTVTEAISTTITSVTEETTAGVAPTINLEIFEGPIYSADNGICYYRVKATVTGDPAPVIYFSKDDSGGAWGKNKVQVNLTNGENYNLVVTAVNSVGTVTNNIALTWSQ